MSKQRYQVFCSAKLQWNGRKLEPFKRSRSQGIAESECLRLAKENPGAVCACLQPDGGVFTIGPTASGLAEISFRAPGER
jgi:hypothetical protein